MECWNGKFAIDETDTITVFCHHATNGEGSFFGVWAFEVSEFYNSEVCVFVTELSVVADIKDFFRNDICTARLGGSGRKITGKLWKFNDFSGADLHGVVQDFVAKNS